MSDASDHRARVNQRLTLNLLIQGAAAHVSVDLHHRVRDELEALRPGLVRRYDRFEAGAYLAMWLSDAALVAGRARTFWNGTDRPDHRFHHHPLLRIHGAALNREAFAWGRQRAWRRRMIPWPGVLYLQLLIQALRVHRAERRHRHQLARLIERAAAEFWGIPADRLRGTVDCRTKLRPVQEPRSLLGRVFRDAAAGWSQVEARPRGWRGGSLRVRAVAWNVPLLGHELVKGTAELVCLHGLGGLDDDTYDAVLAEADQIDDELWMLQAGPAYWRRFVAALTLGQTPAAALMHAARMDPETFAAFSLAVVEDVPKARRLLGDAFDAYDA